MEVLSTASQKLASSLTQQDRQYQHNVKLFINSVEREVSSLINQYQSKIQSLKTENQELRKELQSRKSKHSISQNIQCISPIKRSPNQTTLTIGHSNLSNFFLPKTELFPSTTKQRTLEKPFKGEEVSNRLINSRFQAKGRIQKKRQQGIVESLQLSKSNMNNTKNKFLQIVTPKKEVRNDQQFISTFKPSNELLNTSLSSLCSSLDNSFHAKKSRAKKLKKSQMMKQKNNRREQEQIRKNQSIKNLLKTLRNNINSAPKQVEKRSISCTYQKERPREEMRGFPTNN